MILKVESTDKEDTDQMKTIDFPASFFQFKEGIRQINESKMPKWMDVKVKPKELTYLMTTNQKWRE